MRDIIDTALELVAVSLFIATLIVWFAILSGA